MKSIHQEHWDALADACLVIELRSRGCEAMLTHPELTSPREKMLRRVTCALQHPKTKEVTSLIVVGGHASPGRNPREFRVPKEALQIRVPSYLYAFVGFKELYARPEYFFVSSETVAARAQKAPGAPNFMTVGGITIDLNDVWYFADPAGTYLERWDQLGLPASPPA